MGSGAGLDRCGKSRRTGIRSPDLPARSESLYRLSYPGSDCVYVYTLNTFAASYLNTQGLNNSCLKSLASTLVDLTFQSRCLRQPTLPLSIRINTGSLYRNVSILNYKRDKDNVS